MVDFHSHILPGIDDGSKDLTESLKMLKECIGQGVTVLCATPHFYAAKDTPSLFFERRDRSLSSIQSLIPKELSVIPGAEVYYYEGISKSDYLNHLTISNTDILLLEMPYGPWSHRITEELFQLADSSRVRVMLAHIDRYIKWQPKGIWLKLAEHGVFMQVNADSFLNRHLVRKLDWFIKNELIDVLGSDMHDTSLRKCNISDAKEVILKRYGMDFWESLKDHGLSLLRF